jgi:hypothetical protein
MRYTVGKTVRAFLRTVAMTPYISHEYSSGTGDRWLRYCGRFAERLSVIANAERRDTSSPCITTRRRDCGGIP